MERRAFAFGSIAVPAAIFELLSEKASRKGIVWPTKEGAHCQRAPINARLNLTLEKRVPAGFDGPELPAAALIVPSHSCLKSRRCSLYGRLGGVDAGRPQEEKREEG